MYKVYYIQYWSDYLTLFGKMPFLEYCVERQCYKFIENYVTITFCMWLRCSKSYRYEQILVFVLGIEYARVRVYLRM